MTERDAYYYEEVRRAVGRGAPTGLLGTSTKSLERSLAKLKAVQQAEEEFASRDVRGMAVRSSETKIVEQRSERRSRETLIKVGSQLQRRVRHPDGGDNTVEAIHAQETAQRAEIDDETARGSRKHHRFPKWIQLVPKCVLGFDFALLLYFFAGIANVDWSSPLSLALAFAIALAAMVTLLSYGFLTFTGHRLRSHKNHAGTIHREDVDAVTRAAFVLSIVVIGVLATLMFLRIRSEVLYALGAQAQITALVIAVTVAVVSAVANFLVVGIQGLDGSDQTARLDKLSAAIRRQVARLNRLRTRAAKQAGSPSGTQAAKQAAPPSGSDARASGRKHGTL